MCINIPLDILDLYSENKHFLQLGNIAKAATTEGEIEIISSAPGSFNGSSQSTLLDGRVLVTGEGNAVASQNNVRIYDPKADVWTYGLSMPYNNTYHGQSTLLDGRVLVTGGITSGYTSSALIYDPTTDSWSYTTSMPQKVAQHGQSTLIDGRVMVTGGTNSDGPQRNVYIYDSINETWSRKRDFPVQSSVSQTTLKDGRVLAIAQSRAWFYYPDTDTWVETTGVPIANVYMSLSTLSDGRVLATSEKSYIEKAAIFNASTEQWTSATTIPDYYITYRTQSTMLDGRVLVNGNFNNIGGANYSFIYTFNKSPNITITSPTENVTFSMLYKSWKEVA